MTRAQVAVLGMALALMIAGVVIVVDVRTVAGRIRRWVVARWEALGYRLFPRRPDLLPRAQDDSANGFVITHAAPRGPTAAVYRGTVWAIALRRWDEVQRDTAYRGELQFLKNGKVRATRPPLK